MWAIAALFSMGGDYGALNFDKGLLYALPAWGIVLLSILLIRRPHSSALLFALAAFVVVLYALRSPVASNNKTITMVMDLAILLSGGYLYWKSSDGRIDREQLYEQIRVVARALLAIMYFYGIFHKINTDFLDPEVSCAVGLYAPLASPFGLEDNIYGRYLAIYATFIIEGIAIISLYWRKYFAVGFLLALLFHFIIPISAFSWYMDFSSLVFALYVLSIPREVSATAHATVHSAFSAVASRAAPFGKELIGLTVFGLAILVVVVLDFAYGERSWGLMRHSIGILMWTVFGSVAMFILAESALRHLPYTGRHSARQPAWLFVIPTLFFLSCLSPYLGLKTESSINMFSNLHTEGGQTNHLLFDEPPYLFGYQRDVVRIVDASDGPMRQRAEDGQQVVLFALRDYLRQNPDAWVSYELDGTLHEAVTRANFAVQPGLIERNLLPFKLVDFERPKVCTH
ncbi:hypothetical protein Wenmar_02344 [Wenxinia marina DSM 24838]|uniref:Thiol-disulfide oxidoreductase n=2 Tax=Wenxinia TaxID=653686 RepID=A0A0D0QE32_9RHOB|nr:hypothetical protein [Wenxinia marina]KIQ69273.1 hypothetical protein Wenmar_02344 [Wenxinia marina DSM 24838]